MTESISDAMRDLLRDISPHVVVIGSIARGSQTPNDLDLLFNCDNETVANKIRKIVAKHALTYSSCLPGNWTFNEANSDMQIEILPIHYGKSYTACRRKATQREFWGVPLAVAPAEYC